MFKRGVWLTAGLSAGAIGALYVEKKAKKKLKNSTPPAIIKRVGESSKSLSGDFKDALTEGKIQARKTRQELQSKIYGDN
jgi:hypothetical protein